MKVTPVNLKFGKFMPGDVFDLPDAHARFFIKVGKVSQVSAEPTYQTRMLQAAPISAPVLTSPPTLASDTNSDHSSDAVELDSEGVAWDAATHVATKLKNADGTWRKRPGAKAAAE